MTTNRRFPRHLIVLAGGTVGLTVSFAPILAFTFIVFLKPIAADFGWSRATVSSIMAVQGIVQAMLLPLLGGLIDRIGARRVLLPSLAGLGILVLLLSILPGSLWMWYVVFAVFIPVAAAGSGALAYTHVLTAWFDRRRGIALGIAISGLGLGAMLFPPLAQSIIDGHSWRAAYVVLGVIVLFLGLPLVAMSIRNTPQEMGLAPDHGSLSSDHKADARPPQYGLSLLEASRTHSFRLILPAVFLMGLAIYGIIAHLSAMITDRGIDAQTAAAMVGVLGASSMVARIVVGLLFDRFFAPRVAVFFTFAALLASLILASGTNVPWVGFVAAALLGLGLGAEFDLMAYLCSRYFGLKYYGMLYGIILAAFYIGVGVGSTAAGYAFDVFGSYTLALYVAAGLTVAICALLLSFGPYPEFGRVGAQADKVRK